MALALMRRHKRWLYVFLWLVIAAFIILYIPAFQDEGRGTPGEAVVTVGGLPVSVGEFQRTYYRQRQMYDRLYQGRLDENMLRQLGIEEQVLEGLVTERLVELETKRLGHRRLRRGGGARDRDVARVPGRRGVHRQGRDPPPAGAAGPLRGGVRGVAAAPAPAAEPGEPGRRARLGERRGGGARVPPPQRAGEARVRARRRRPLPGRPSSRPRTRSRRASRRRRTPTAFPRSGWCPTCSSTARRSQPQVAVTDRDIEMHYQDRREEFRQEEEACASHILVKVKAGEAAEGHPEAEARAIAQGLLDQVRAGGDFAALAKASSEDQGSAQSGGDLGCFPPGRMVPEFDDAVFALAPGQVSELVKTSFGYHVIRLASKRESTVLPLAQVKERIRATRHRAQGARARRAEGAGPGRGPRQGPVARGGREGAGAHGAEERALRRGRDPARPLLPGLVARVFALKPGQAEKEGFALPQGAAFVSLAEVQPARAPGARGRPRTRCGRTSWTRRPSRRRARPPPRSGRRRRRSASRRRPRPSGLVRKETPALTGRGQALGDLGTGGALEEAAFSLAEKTTERPRAHVLRVGGAARAREEALRRRGAREAEGADRRVAAAAEAVGAVPGLRGRGARPLRDHPERAGLAPRARPGA